MRSDLSKLDLLVIQIDGLHIGNDLVLVAALGIDGEATNIRSPWSKGRPRKSGASPRRILCKARQDRHETSHSAENGRWSEWGQRPTRPTASKRTADESKMAEQHHTAPDPAQHRSRGVLQPMPDPTTVDVSNDAFAGWTAWQAD